MLAERVKEWTEEKQEGLRQGRQEAIKQARAILRQDLEERFGPLSEEACRRLEAISFIPDLMELRQPLPYDRHRTAIGFEEEEGARRFSGASS